MWTTSSGARKLMGAELEFFTGLIDHWVDADMFIEFMPEGTEDDIFSKLSAPDKYLVLRYVFKALTTESPPPFASALLESSIYSVICNTIGCWEGSDPEQIASDIEGFFLENEDCCNILDKYLPGDASRPLSSKTVLAAITASVRDLGSTHIAKLFVNRILPNSHFKLDEIPTGDPRFALLGIDTRYWSAGPELLRALRKEARDADETFGIIYWDLYALTRSPGQMGLVERWAALRDAAKRVERSRPAALTYPKLEKHFNDGLVRHVLSLEERASASARRNPRMLPAAASDTAASSGKGGTAGSKRPRERR